MTVKMLDKVKRVIACELDPRLVIKQIDLLIPSKIMRTLFHTSPSPLFGQNPLYVPAQLLLILLN